MTSTRDTFARLRARARLGIAVEAASVCAIVGGAFVFGSYLIDRTLHLEVGFRAILALVVAACLVRAVRIRLLAPMRVDLGDDEFALAVERRDPQLRQSLISAVQFERDLESATAHAGESASLKRHVVDDVTRRAIGIRFHRAIDRARVARFAGVGIAAIAAVGLWSSLSSDEARLWFARNVLLADEPWPRRTHLRFLDHDPSVPLRLAEREDVTLRVEAAGVVPDRIELDCRFASGETFTRTLDQATERVFGITLEALLEDAVVVARGGDGSTAELRITLIPRPRLALTGMTLVYPEYMRRPARDVVDTGGDVRVPRGGSLTLTARSSKPLRSASLTFAQQHVPAELAPDGLGVTAVCTPTESGPLRLDAIDLDDLGPDQPTQIHVRVVEDTAPVVDFVTDGVGAMITPIARIPGFLDVRDDYGVRTARAEFKIAETKTTDDGAPETAPAEFEPAPFTGLDALVPGVTEAELEIALDLQALCPDPDPNSPANRVRPGHTLSLRFAAHDDFAPEPNTGTSETLHLRVVTAEALLTELRRRQTEQRRDLERVLDDETRGRDELAEIVPPGGDDPRAMQARLRIQAIARQQNSLGMRVQGIAARYRQILREMLNNRLFEPQLTSRLDAQIVSPLMALASGDFPVSAARTADFATSGDPDLRDQLVASYDNICDVIRQVLAHMERTEDLAALIESLRLILDMQGRVGSLVESALEAQGTGLFDRPPGRDPNRPGDREKK